MEKAMRQRRRKRYDKKMAARAAKTDLRDEMIIERETKVFSVQTFLRILKAKWHLFLWAAFTLTLVLAMFFYWRNLGERTAVMSLNYEESSKGQNPNGSRFDLSELRSEECLSAAIASAGLQEELTVEELSDRISLSPYSNGRISTEDSYYINSSYRISLEMPARLYGTVSAGDLLELVCESYKDWFSKTYVATAKGLRDTEADLEAMDYGKIGSYFSTLASRVSRYLEVRTNTASSFVAEDGSTFKSLKQKVNNLQNYDLATYNSYIWEAGISRDPASRITVLEYTNTQLEWDYEESMQKSEMYRQVVDEYNSALTSSVLIPTYDEDYEFYMARTKTGIDDIAKEADAELSSAVSAKLSISTNEDKIQKLQAGGTSEQYAKADSLVAAIEEKLQALIDEVIRMDDAYVREKTGSYLTFTYGTDRFLDQISFREILAWDLALWVVLYLGMVSRTRRRAHRMVAWMRQKEEEERE